MARQSAPAKWSDGDVLLIGLAATHHVVTTNRFGKAWTRWVRAMRRGRKQAAAPLRAPWCCHRSV